MLSSSQSSSNPAEYPPPKTSPLSISYSLGLSVPTIDDTLYRASIDDFGRSMPHFLSGASRSSNAALASPSVLEPEKELQLFYGYTVLFTELQLDLSIIAQTVPLIARQFKSRPLDSPLLFSSRALDITIDGTHSLIRSFVYEPQYFLRELQGSSPHNISAFLKWILARYTNEQGQHGFLDWETYVAWSASEKEHDYPLTFIVSHLLTQLPSSTSTLLTSLLDLFCSVSAYSHLNGMTIQKCGTIFGSFIFGWEVGLTFEGSYSNWLRFSHATEHMVLAYLRDQKSTSATGQLPSRLESCIRGYPNVIPSLTLAHPAARLERVVRFRRKVQTHTKNLIQHGREWEIPGSKTWNRLQAQTDSSPRLTFTQSYKDMLNITSELNSNRSGDGLEQVDFQAPRFKSLVEKEWSGFISQGFKEAKDKTLEFDLNETKRPKPLQRRKTLEWNSFTGSGFLGREIYSPDELDLSSEFAKTIVTETPKVRMDEKPRKPDKALPIFDYDSTPEELEAVLVDENFFEAWIDVNICSGWNQENGPKELSWAVVHFNSKPIVNSMNPSSIEIDQRAGNIWVLFEELIPRAYQELLISSQMEKQKKSAKFSLFPHRTRSVSKEAHDDSHGRSYPFFFLMSLFSCGARS